MTHHLGCFVGVGNPTVDITGIRFDPTTAISACNDIAKVVYKKQADTKIKIHGRGGSVLAHSDHAGGCTPGA